MPENKIDIKNIETLLKELIAQLKHNHSGILLAAIYTLLKTPGIDQSLSASLQEALAKLSLSEAFTDYTKRAAEKMPDERALMIAEMEVLYHEYEEASKNFMKALDEVSSDEFLAPYFDEITQKHKAYQAAKGTHHEHRALGELSESICKFVKAMCDKLAPAQQTLNNAQANHNEALNKANTDPTLVEHCNAERQKANAVDQKCSKRLDRCMNEIIDSCPALKVYGVNIKNSAHDILKGGNQEIILNGTKESVMNNKYLIEKPISTKISYAKCLKPASSKVQGVENSRQNANIKTH